MVCKFVFIVQNHSDTHTSVHFNNKVLTLGLTSGDSQVCSKTCVVVQGCMRGHAWVTIRVRVESVCVCTCATLRNTYLCNTSQHLLEAALDTVD